MKICIKRGTKNKYDIEFKDDGQFDKVKKAKYSIMMKQDSESSWSKDWRMGIAARCKCGRAFYIHDINLGSGQAVVEASPREGLIVPWFCENCRQAFLSPSMTCPRCGKAY